MLKRTSVCAMLIASIFGGSALAHSRGAWAADFGTNEQAKAMLDRAILELKANKVLGKQLSDILEVSIELSL